MLCKEELFSIIEDFSIRTHHDWPLQMYENLLISRVKTRAIASVLTPGGGMRDGCVLYNDYHKNIEKCILIGRIFSFPRC